SIPFEELKPLFSMDIVEFFNLQMGLTAEQKHVLQNFGVIDLTAQITDFADTAALMSGLNLIITVDTATAHLAGAMGRPVWTLLSNVPDWRWGLGSDKSPWYPSMQLFRQPTSGDWASVIKSVAYELNNTVKVLAENSS